MEDIKPRITMSRASEANGNNSDSREAYFVDLCKNGLSLEENMYEEALKLFKETKHILAENTSAFGNGTREEADRFWFASVLYSVTRLSHLKEEKADDTGFNLCQILRVAKLNISDFFKELPHFVIKVGPILTKTYGADWENKLEAKRLHASFVQMSALSRFYKRAYAKFFLTSDTNVEKRSALATSAGYVLDYRRFGWLLFLTLRVHAFNGFQDLITCTNGLVSILAILILHVPNQFRNFSLQDAYFVKKGEKGVNLLASLCNIYETSEDELLKTMGRANNLIENILKKKPRPAIECETVNLKNTDPDGLVIFKDIMEEPSFSCNLSILEQDYKDAIASKGEIDETIFLNEEDPLLYSGGTMAGTSAKRNFDIMASPSQTLSSPLSPRCSPSVVYSGSHSKITATPVGTAMTTAKWLRTVICPLPARPSQELERFFLSCDRDITNEVIRRAQIILEAIFPSSFLGDQRITGRLQNANLMDTLWAQNRRSEALKLYYRVLEAMCRAEAHILNANNLTSLLTNERFHRCMLACSAELVLATHKTITMLFPAVLERTGITAFDLSKVIESFIRHEESLPRELRRHLNSLEERLLESMVWEKGSSMYNSLIVARPSLATEINFLGMLAEPMPSLDAIAVHNNLSSGGLPPVPSSPCKNGDNRSPKRLRTDYRSVLVERNSFTSPVKDRLTKTLQPPLQSAFATPTRPNPGGGGETCAETGITIFFTKINKLAAVRINGMVERLQLSQQMRERVYCLFQQILIRQTSLFFYRHIDQIILCCFYGVAKISQLKLTFKEIINNYRKQSQCKPEVFRSVFVYRSSSARGNGRTGRDHIDVVEFYNDIFIPAVKPLLVEVNNSGVPSMNTNGNSNDGQCPGSPEVSSFPSLPDMSPKKVSSAQNVYVSPLRTSKKDALISHSSKSFYACVGESTRAYQSPSKDLTAINNHLNGSRRIVRATLDFNSVDVGLVSDSLVTNTLNLQNSTSTSSSSAALVLKSEPA